MRFLADENLNNDIVRGIIRRNAQIDIVRVQDVELSGAADPDVLEWAARENRVLLSHDVATITKYAYQRIESSLEMPGVIEIPQALPIGEVIEDLVLIAEVSLEGEWKNQIIYLPLKR
jgi:hypothetical protein